MASYGAGNGDDDAEDNSVGSVDVNDSGSSGDGNDCVGAGHMYGMYSVDGCGGVGGCDNVNVSYRRRQI